MLGTFTDLSVSAAPQAYALQPRVQSSTVVLTAPPSFGYWTERVATQSEGVAARELAGLPDDELSALAAVYASEPRAKAQGWMRNGYPVAVGALCIAVLFAIGHFAQAEATAGLGRNETLVAVFGGIALLAGALGGLSACRQLPLDTAHARLGLYVCVLDERHPWLYTTRRLMTDSAAEAYRVKVLTERGPLRGVDHVMMAMIASAQEGVGLTHTAHSVARQVQGVPATLSATGRTPLDPC